MCDTICAVMTREDFQFELEALHSEAMRVIHVGHAIDRLTSTAKEVALYDEMVGMIDARIRTLMMRTNVFVEYTRSESVGLLPSPRLVNIKQTLINFDKENRK